MKKTLGYEFKAINEVDYELELTYEVTGQLFNTIFPKAKEKLKRKKIDIKGASIDGIDSFKVPIQYLNIIRTAIKPVIIKAANEVRKDRIEMLSNYVSDMEFRKIEGEWYTKIIVSGQYVDKR